MKKKNNAVILKEVLERIEPSKEDLEEINSIVDSFLDKLNKKLKDSKIEATCFVGGSFAKKTLIKNDFYDIDLFVRFDKKYRDEEISKLTEKILKTFIKNLKVIHGSRDYFRIKIASKIYLEVIPVIKVNNPKDARNITDLSYSHVNYIKKKIKQQKLLDDIKLAKAFCFANRCYGAESYINGFSGYALELLVYYYKGFTNFIKAVARAGKEKIIIDPAKHYKNKQSLFLDMNSSKLQSPIILVDPTFKQRNALAALNDDTFERFKDTCKRFIKHPSKKAFKKEKTNLSKIQDYAKKKNYEFLLLEVKTQKQEGDIAGSKLYKFYNFLNNEISKYFNIKDKGFNYNLQKSARFYIVSKAKNEIVSYGPKLTDGKHVKAFKQSHKEDKLFEKKGRIYAKEKVKFTLRKFVEDWIHKNSRTIKEMSIVEMRVV